MKADLVTATESDLEGLMPLVSAYHAFESITQTESIRQSAISKLLQPNSPFGRVLLVKSNGEMLGYLALCFGYSIELGGRDAFIDEFFLLELARGQGLGTEMLRQIQAEAKNMDIKALHLEVSHKNQGAQSLYQRCGFRARDHFHLMTCPLNPSA